MSAPKGADALKNSWSIFLWSTIAYLYDSLGLIILAICMPLIIKEMNLSLPQAGMLASVTMIGGALGAIYFGCIADNHGYKKAVVWALIEFGFFTGLVYFVNTWESFMVVRFLAGFGIGGVWGPCVALVTKYWNAGSRSWAVSTVLSSFAVGSILSSGLGAFLLSGHNWRTIFIIGATSIIAGVLFHIFVKDAEKRDNNGVSPKRKVGLWDLFTKDLFKTTLLATFVALFYMSGFWGVNSWVPTFLVTERGFSIDDMGTWNMIMYMGMFVGYLLGAFLSNRMGCKGTLILFFIISGLTVLLDVLIPNPRLLFWIGPLMGLGFGGLAGLQGIYFGELFHQEICALAGGFCFNMGRAGAVIAPYTVGVLASIKGLTYGIGTTSLLFFLGALTVYFLPEH